ncbi:TPA: oligosaccharide flippase family protein [Escherichia coli]|nr:oligosaccharide flippase family protein [Escherichia coli]HAW7314163.1 oligosaccharide flippase family protein [Escherichia coli]
MSLKKISTTISKVIGGNALAQIIVILGTPLLTRIYQPSDFGIYSTIMAVVLILGVIACGRYDQIMYNFDDKYSWYICFCNGLVIAICISLLCLIATGALFYFFKFDISYLVIAPAIFTFAILQLYTSYFSLYSYYRTIIILNIIRTSSLVVLQLILFKFSKNGLIVSFLLSQIICILFCLKLGRKLNRKFKFKVSFLKIREAGLSSVQSLASSFSSQLPVLFISGQYGFYIVSLYGLAVRLTQVPIIFFTNAVRPYILGELNRNKRNYRLLSNIIWRSSILLLSLSMIGIILINLFATDFFKIYAGEEWEGAGEIASALAWWLLVSFANVTSTSYLTVIGRFRSLFIYDMFLLVFRVMAVCYSFYMKLSFIDFIYIYSIIGMLFNLGIIGYAIKCSIRDAKNSDCYI